MCCNLSRSSVNFMLCVGVRSVGIKDKLLLSRERECLGSLRLERLATLLVLLCDSVRGLCSGDEGGLCSGGEGGLCSWGGSIVGSGYVCLLSCTSTGSACAILL